jgi:hypothetical protein
VREEGFFSEFFSTVTTEESEHTNYRMTYTKNEIEEIEKLRRYNLRQL